jgi:thiamine-monophosphate kinase
VRESELLKHIYQHTAGMTARWPHVLVGPGDDCAVVRSAGPSSRLVTVDQLVEGRHFMPGTPIDLIARKAVARSVSDIAAMGGSTSGGWGLATGLIPEGFAAATELTDALHKWSAHWNFPLVGGDIAAAPRGTPLVLTVTVAGIPHPSRGPVLRSGAQPGDWLWTTGRLGDSLKSGRHLTFEPRLAEAAWLCDTFGRDLHAMIDISDGLGRDAGRIAEAGHVRITIESAAVPCHEGVTDVIRALSNGEDHELCFCTGPGVELPSATPTGVLLTRIGSVDEGAGCFVLINGRPRDAADLGWDHVG